MSFMTITFFPYSAPEIESFKTFHIVTAGFLKGNSLRGVECFAQANRYGLCSCSQYA